MLLHNRIFSTDTNREPQERPWLADFWGWVGSYFNLFERRSLMEALKKIQGKLNVPKAQRNNFGKYNYRSCEDILAALKPLLLEYGCFLTINDDIVNIGDRFYVKATARISDGEASEVAQGFAREEETKKGMDGAQITGAASSYARKYALNGLFAIDDTKDADSTSQHETNTNKKENKALTELPELTPANKVSWERAVARMKIDGNIDIVKKHMTVSADSEKLIKEESDAIE